MCQLKMHLNMGPLLDSAQELLDRPTPSARVVVANAWDSRTKPERPEGLTGNGGDLGVLSRMSAASVAELSISVLRNCANSQR